VAYGRDPYGVAPYAAEPAASNPTAVGNATLPAITAASTAIAKVVGAGVATLPAITAAGVAKALANAAVSATLPALTAAGLGVAPSRATTTASLPAITASATAHAPFVAPQGERLGPWPNYASPFSIAKKKAPPVPTAPPEVIEPETIRLDEQIDDERNRPPVGDRSRDLDSRLREHARQEQRLSRQVRSILARAEELARVLERQHRDRVRREQELALDRAAAFPRVRRRPAPAEARVPVPATADSADVAAKAAAEAAAGAAADRAAVERLIEETRPPTSARVPTIVGAEGLSIEQEKMLMMMVAASEAVWRR
jgi:hypothetical protein